jgi:hypothetical protein
MVSLNEYTTSFYLIAIYYAVETTIVRDDFVYK